MPIARNASIQRKLAWGFAAAALLVLGLMALIVDAALRQTLAWEDAEVLEGQAKVLLQRLAKQEHLPPDALIRHEKAEWRALDANGQLVSQSALASRIPESVWSNAQARAQEQHLEGRTFSVLSRPLVMPHGPGTLLVAMDRGHEAEMIRMLRWVLLGSWIAAGALAALLGQRLAAWGLAPLRLIAHETGAIRMDQLETRLDPAAFPRELAELVVTLNQTLARIQEAFARLNHLGGELAHELRTPLQNLRAEVESRVLHRSGSEISNEFLGSMLEECDRMAALIEQMLLLARSEHPGALLRTEPLVLRAFVQACLEPFELLAEEKQVSLQQTIPEDLILEADAGLLRRALGNLVANALRHTPSGGRVQVRATVGPDGLSLIVQDSGEGIPPDLLPRLGQRFVRGPRGEGPAEGFGLGLAIVQSIARLHGATLGFESHLGEGTTAMLCFPSLSRN